MGLLTVGALERVIVDAPTLATVVPDGIPVPRTHHAATARHPRYRQSSRGDYRVTYAAGRGGEPAKGYLASH